MNLRFLDVLVITLVIACPVLSPSEAAAQTKRVFLTSETGAGNLGDGIDWPCNGGLTGLAAGDAICQNLALSAGLSNASDFVAWLSDSTSDAYCRIHDLTGTKANNCGQADLPDWAGPWVRMDGFPFAESIDLALSPNGVVYAPVAFDEWGSQAINPMFTATDAEGVFNPTPGACSDWTSAVAAGVTCGSPQATTDRWTEIGSGQCDDTRPLLCMEAGGSGGNLLPFSHDGAMVFVTSVGGTGELGSWPKAGGQVGIDAGDAICQTLADDASLVDSGPYKAWLSNSSTDARDRLTHDGPWVRVDGVPVAFSKADLTDQWLYSSINVSETGVYHDTWVQTGTLWNGTWATQDCSGWTDGSGGTGRKGLSPYTSYGWTEVNFTSCSSLARLYCFSDSDAWYLFINDFESGDFSMWSVVVGDIP